MENELAFSSLKNFLENRLQCTSNQIVISKLSGGFSNITFLVQTPQGKFALRRPPFGEKISKAHDMEREFKVLAALEKAGYSKSPKPILLSTDESIFGAPFFLMEFVEGIVLRNKLPNGITFGQSEFKKLSENALDSLLELHHLELEKSGLIQLGKPEGYVQRQVEGWIDRYFRAKTNDLPEMENVAEWLKTSLPQVENVGFIHNDYKYDNLVLNSENTSEIKAVLDWEMATVGDPLMDLGTSLAYWAEADDPDILKMFNMSHLPGNMSRQDVIEYYAARSPLDLRNMLYYYIFGLFKVAVIAQQIFRRFSMGFASDPRFASLIHVVIAAGKKAEQTIQTEKI
ncbi:phosphotransferase family protein [Algoriphagus lacus]|uniref:Phosphotransferase family protein n=1 Tax=Algoriphagus lacus TaxID=2056311 RepID=A0A418PQL0_9BACT|nr:phosphotransferase family protein [Algoriphagus lacus]RIW14584.1 phosphotransferase family protein [Algoriphagus lacus]